MIPVLISKLSSMILLTLVGLLTVRIGLIKPEEGRAFSKMVVFVLQPCMIVRAFQIELTSERIFGFVSAMIFCFLIYFFWTVLSFLLKKPLKLNKVEEMTLIYSNVGNLVLPLISMVLGEEMVFYASAIQLPFNAFLWTHCNTVLSGEKRMDFKKIFLNSNLIAIYLGLFLMITGLRFPDVIDTAVSSLSSMVGPLSMIVIGMVIGQEDLKTVFLFKKGYLVSFLRLIVYPMLVLGILFLTGFLRIYPTLVPVFQVIFFALAAPPAAMVSQLALLYDENPGEAGRLNVLGTVLCGVTLPLVLSCFEFLFH